MRDTNAYVMLMSSLPHQESLFLAKRPSLSRLKLDRRLRVLSPEHKSVLKSIERALEWRHLSLVEDVQEVVDRAHKALSEADSRTLEQVVLERLELRTCIAALRRRAHGLPAPEKGEIWGFGRWIGRVLRYWEEPTFRLDGVFPWIGTAHSLLEGRDVLGLERMILEQSYKLLKRRAASHHFDFEAVVIYVLQWSIVDRWARYNGEAALRRFDDLTQIGLGDFAEIDFSRLA